MRPTRKAVPKAASIPSHWIPLHPAKVLDPALWIEVHRRVEERGISKDDRESVREVVIEVIKAKEATP